MEVQWDDNDTAGSLPRSVVLKIPTKKNMEETAEKVELVKEMMDKLEDLDMNMDEGLVKVGNTTYVVYYVLAAGCLPSLV